MRIHNYGQATLAPLVSPQFVGDLEAPTPATSDSSTTAATVGFVNNAIASYSKYYRNCYNIQTIATTGCSQVGNSLIFDASGNLYISVLYFYNGTTYTGTSYIYKVTPTGSITQFASTTTISGSGTSLAFDASGNLYWAVSNEYNGTTYAQTSYVYKITPSGTLTTFASQATTGSYANALIFDASGNLYWAVTNYYNGTVWALTSYVYKITSSGTLTTFASQSTIGAVGTSLAFDTSGNLFWSIQGWTSNGTYAASISSYIYKITPAASISQFATVSTKASLGGCMIIDSSNNLYWSVPSWYDGTTYNQISNLYKVTSAGVITTLASKSTYGAHSTNLIFDAQGNLYWSIAQQYNGSSYTLPSYVFKINTSGQMSTFAQMNTNEGSSIGLAFDANQNLFMGTANWFDGTTHNQNFYLSASYLHSAF